MGVHGLCFATVATLLPCWGIANCHYRHYRRWHEREPLQEVATFFLPTVGLLYLVQSALGTIVGFSKYDTIECDSLPLMLLVHGAMVLVTIVLSLGVFKAALGWRINGLVAMLIASGFLGWACTAGWILFVREEGTCVRRGSTEVVFTMVLRYAAGVVLLRFMLMRCFVRSLVLCWATIWGVAILELAAVAATWILCFSVSCLPGNGNGNREGTDRSEEGDADSGRSGDANDSVNCELETTSDADSVDSTSRSLSAGRSKPGDEEVRSDDFHAD